MVRAILLSVIMLGVGKGAFAAEDPEALIREGVQLRREGKDARAEGYFRRAYQLANTPRTAAQLGLVELAINQYLEAELRLSEALATQDAWISEHRETLEKSRALARRHLRCVELTGVPPNSTLENDGVEARPVPRGGVVCLAPGGPSVLRIVAPGHRPVEVHVDGGAGDTRTFAFPSTPTASQTHATPRPPLDMPAKPVEHPPTTAINSAPPRTSSVEDAGHGARVAGVVLASVGLAVGITGAVLYWQSGSRLDEYQSAVNSNGEIPWNPRDESWKTFQTAGIAGLAIGGAATVGGVVLFLASSPKDSTAGTGVAFLPGPGLGVLSYRGAF